jgi:5'-nucleotidase
MIGTAMMLRAIFLFWIGLATGCAGLAPRAPVALRIVALNDFHGHLEASKAGPGGAAHLAGAIRELKAGHAASVVVAAGDLVGASPLVSSLFGDEPAVVALSDAGLEITSVGNHEFDRGREALERLQRVARFRYLAANVVDRATGRPMFPAYVVRSYGGVPVAFIGAVLRGTAQIVRASGVATVEFRDEADSVNAVVPELRAQGVEAIVLLIHQGGETRGGPNECADFRGPILDVLKRLDRAVDVVVSGHTHQAYVCRIDGRLVTSAGSYGRYVTAIDVTLDAASREVLDTRAENFTVDPRRFAADPAVAAYVSSVVALAAARSSQPVAIIHGEFSMAQDAAGESSLGDLVADSQIAAFRGAGVQVAFMNPGGLRASLASPRTDGSVNHGELHSVLPFGNTLVAMTLTGAQLLRVLEQQWRATPGDRTRMLQVSEELRYAWDDKRPIGQRIVPGSVRVAGASLEPSTRYRVVVNDFLAGGGDGFTTFTEGRDLAAGPSDLEALEAFLRERPVTAMPPAGRIRKVVSGTTF